MSEIITSAEQANLILQNNREGIPYEAIEYLQKQPYSKELIGRIIFALNRAYTGFYDEESEDEKIFSCPTPLWYAIVAETHVYRELIIPIINILSQTENDWDALNEQGMYVLCLLAENYPEEVMEQVAFVIDQMIEHESIVPCLFLFDVFYFADKKKWTPWFVKTLEKPNFYWREPFATDIADLQIKEAIPVLEKLLEEAKGTHEAIEYEYALKELKTGIVEYPNSAVPYNKQREDWKTHYKKFEDRFTKQAEREDEGFEFYHELKNKIGRNDQCPCGSGKKYKKCHGI